MERNQMKQLFPILKEISKNFVKFVENYPGGSTDGTETRTLTKKLTLQNVGKSAFGIDAHSFDSYDKESRFTRLANNFLKPGTAQSILVYLVSVFPVLTKYLSIRIVPKDISDDLCEMVSDVISYRTKNNMEGKDFFQYLLHLKQHKNLSDEEVTAHASTFFLDGFETSSSVLSFIFLNLALNPQYQERIREEIRQYEKEYGELDYDQIQEMPFVNACIYESLRATPSLDMLVKVCTEPYEYTSTNPDFKEISVKLQPDDVVIISYGFCCRDSKYFPEPDKFKPERMMDKDAIHKNSFLPFSNGPRMCLGLNAIRKTENKIRYVFY